MPQNLQSQHTLSIFIFIPSKGLPHESIDSSKFTVVKRFFFVKKLPSGKHEDEWLGVGKNCAAATDISAMLVSTHTGECHLGDRDTFRHHGVDQIAFAHLAQLNPDGAGFMTMLKIVGYKYPWVIKNGEKAQLRRGKCLLGASL